MKQIVLAFLLGTTPFLFSCQKEQLLESSVPTSNQDMTSSKQRMNCEPFGFGILTLNNGTVNTLNMNMSGDLGLSANASGLANTNLILNGNFYKHSNGGSFLFSLSTLAPGILQPQTDPEVDWKIFEANENATYLSAIYKDINPNAIFGNMNNNIFITTNLAIEKPNTIVNVGNINLNNRILTLTGRASSDDGFIINVTGNMNFQNSEIKLINVRPERVLFNFPNANSNIQVKSGSKFRGTILAPAGTVVYNSPTSFEGSIIAKTIQASASLLSIGNTTFIQKTYCNGYQWEPDYECAVSTVETNLMAGQNTDAGQVTATNDGTNLIITYTTSNGWKLSEIHLYVGEYDNIPGNPSPGLFPYHATFGNNNNTSYTKTIPLINLPPCFVIAAHAVVKKGSQIETAWAQGPALPGGSWAMHFNYCLVTCN